jgi:hypothetical protein
VGNRFLTQRWVDGGSLIRQLVFFEFWSDLQMRLARWPRSRQWALLAVFGLGGLAARLWAESHVASYDFESYVVVSDVVLEGNNPYETGRYKYGPIWFLVLAVVRWLAQEPEAFRLALVLLLTSADLLIAYLLMRQGYLAAAGLFLLSPITIAISGQHVQFDNVAVLFALLATLAVAKSSRGPLTRYDALAVILLGMSLSTKHIFIVFPLWLAMRQGSVRRAAFYGLGPLLFFLATLVPSWLANGEALVESVFRYRSADNAPFLRAVLPDEVVWGLTNRGTAVFVFLGILAIVGFAYRRLPAFESGLVYAITLVVLSTAVVDQYLPIPMSGVAVFLNLGFLYWLVLCSAHLLGNPETLNVPIFTDLRTHVAPYPGTVFQDMLFPLLAGWILMNFSLHRRGFLVQSRNPTNTEVGSRTM